MSRKPSKSQAGPPRPNIFLILGAYRNQILLLGTFAISANGLSLWLPKVVSHAIDAFARWNLALSEVVRQFGFFSLGIFVFTYLQNILQVYTSEQVARDLRDRLASTISRQSFAYVEGVGAGRLLTNLTSDMDSIKLFVSQAVPSLISSLFLILGASVLLLLTNWRLGLAVLTIVPVIGATFFLTLRQVRALFLKGREIIDRLNKVINESILGAALIRVLHSERQEEGKFTEANDASRDIGLSIVGVFSRLIPSITFLASLAPLIILILGGHFILQGRMSLGDFAAFNAYVGLLIFPILMLGFISNFIAQAAASYGRIAQVLNAPVETRSGSHMATLTGKVEVKNLTVRYGEKAALANVSFAIAPHSRTAIIGPTAAGKTQLLYALSNLIQPSEGEILYDGVKISDYDVDRLHEQIGLVFQDSIVFNMSLRENIAFSTSVSDTDLERAIATAALEEFIASLPDGLDTIVSERGTSLSGGQKQRLMLARALALNPRVLLLDDFTARVDGATEKKILHNLTVNYPELTLLSVTQKVATVEEYDQIILLMEGEVLATGTHQELLQRSPEYVQIYHSQQSTERYEIHAH